MQRIDCAQKRNEAAIRQYLGENGQLEEASQVFAGLAPYPTTMVAASTLQDGPCLFVAADPGRCYSRADIGKTIFDLQVETTPKPGLSLSFSYWSKPVSSLVSLRLDSSGCLRPGTFLHAFLQACLKQPVHVVFEGDRGKHGKIAAHRSWTVPLRAFMLRRRIHQLLSAIAAAPHVHDWDGCKCTDRECGETRDTEHKWKGCTCLGCGKLRDAEHQWKGCLCEICKATRNDQGHQLTEHGVCKQCGFVDWRGRSFIVGVVPPGGPGASGQYIGYFKGSGGEGYRVMARVTEKYQSGPIMFRFQIYDRTGELIGDQGWGRQSFDELLQSLANEQREEK